MKGYGTLKHLFRLGSPSYGTFLIRCLELLMQCDVHHNLGQTVSHGTLIIKKPTFSSIIHIFNFYSTLTIQFLVWEHSKTMLTIFCPILTIYLPPVDMFSNRGVTTSLKLRGRCKNWGGGTLWMIWLLMVFGWNFKKNRLISQKTGGAAAPTAPPVLTPLLYMHKPT